MRGASHDIQFDFHNDFNCDLLHTYTEQRLAQFLDEDDHKKCVEGNKQALQADKLERLRALKDEIAKEEWMFVPNRNVTSFSGWKSGS